MNGDGALDQLAADDYGTHVRLGDGRGNFGAELNTGEGLRAFRAIDLDGDGRLDLVGLSGTDAVVIQRGHGDGTFSAARELDGGTSLIGADGIDVADLNNDGVLRAVVPVPAAGVLDLALGRTDGGPVNPARGSSRICLTVLHRDGGLGLVGTTASSVIMSRWTPGLGFDTSTSRTTATPGTPLGVACGDVNGDGLTDVVSVSSWQPNNDFYSALDTFLGNGVSIDPAQASPTREGFSGHVLAADLNRDGFQDAIIGIDDRQFGGDAGIEVLLGSPGGLGPPHRMPVAQQPGPMAVGDLNADGWPDVVLSSGGSGANTVTVLLAPPVARCWAP